MSDARQRQEETEEYIMAGTTRRAFGAGLLAGGLIAAPGILRAQPAWPQKPVRILIPFAAGGAADALARVMSEQFPQVSGGQPLIVENKPGAGGTLAAAEVARVADDGHSLLLGDIGANAVAQALFPQLPYKVDGSFKHVIHLANLPMAMIAHPSVGDGTVQGVIKLAKEKPGSLNYASAGPGGAAHLMMELFKRQAGLDIVHVPYRGGAAVLQATMTNEVQLSISTISTARGFIEAKSVRAVGVGSSAPVKALPDVQPIAKDVPGFEALTWHGIHVNAGTSPEIVEQINQVFNKLLLLPEIQRKFAIQTAEPVGGTSAAYSAFVASETAKWGEVVRNSNIKAS
jgi:tripartite-type tricarboxylate transporter receptor subunit TctC